MSNLFSHAEPPEHLHESAPAAPDGNDEASTAVIQVSVRLDQAWEGFTEYIHLWWPAEFTAFGEETHVEFLEDVLGEEGVGGERHDLAQITALEPPLRLELAWTLDRGVAAPSRVVIDFADIGTGGAAELETGAPGGTRVSVTQEGAGRGAAADIATDQPVPADEPVHTHQPPRAHQLPHGHQLPQVPVWPVILERYARFMATGT